ncbi:MAG: fatty acid desaturase [Polyangiaceae bacterium]
MKPALPAEAFEPARGRLLWLPVHLTAIVLGIVGIARGWVAEWSALPVSLAIGASFAGLTFLAHETLHGAVVRGRGARRWLGGLCFVPFAISARLWIAWHNVVHHGNTNGSDDPDAYPRLEQYRDSRSIRILTDHLGPGGGRINGLLSLLIGFTVQSTHMLIVSRWRGMLSAREQRRALLETGLALAGWGALAWAIGWQGFAFAYLVPLLVANMIVMGFILTNHALSPLTHVNDPLLNSLSVTTPRWIEWLTLRFGFHVEHHLFPWMSSRHAPLVRALVRERWPERYQSLPLKGALLALHRTGRVYKSDTTLVDVPRGAEWSALLPRPVQGPQREHEQLP